MKKLPYVYQGGRLRKVNVRGPGDIGGGRRILMLGLVSAYCMPETTL